VASKSQTADFRSIRIWNGSQDRAFEELCYQLLRERADLLDAEIQKLILQMAKGNPRWGCVRVRGELLKLGHVVSATAIRKLLRRNRIGPAVSRSRQTWTAFLRAQASAIVLTDFFTVDTVFLKRLYVHLYMELETRRVIWFAVTDRPDAA
jgi:putative transposase